MKKPVTALLVAISFFGCDLEIFDTPEVEPLYLSGKILLQSNSDHSNVFVWGEELNLKAWSDESGHYKLEIPPPPNQGYGAGYNGFLTIYFFKENYLTDSLQIQFSAGYLTDGQSVVDNRGNIQASISLIHLYISNFQLESGAVDFGNNVNYLLIDESVELELEISNLSDRAHEFYISFCNNVWPENGFSNNGVYLKAWDSSDVPRFAVSPESFSSAIFFLPNEKRVYKSKIRIRKKKDTNKYILQQLSSGGYILSQTEFATEKISLMPFVRARHKETPAKLFAALDTNLTQFRSDAAYFFLRPNIPELQIQIIDPD